MKKIVIWSILLFGIVVIVLYSYFSRRELNTVTGRKQLVNLTPEEEVAMGLNAAPQMAKQFGGLHADRALQDSVKTVGQRLVSAIEAYSSPYKFDFHVLADVKTINAFAVPGGEIFVTMGLLKQLKSADELAGVLGHEVGHVIGRHSAEQMVKRDLLQGLAGAAGAAGGDYYSARTIQYVGDLIKVSYSQDDELESDDFAVKYMIQSGYKPDALLEAMSVLEKGSGGREGTEFARTHPSPDDREAKIREAIANYMHGDVK